MSNTFVFFHVGTDIQQPQMLVDSIRITNKDANIVFCSDSSTPDIEKVTSRVNVAGDSHNLMAFRLKAFIEANVESPALYVDTDMLFLRTLRPSEILGEKKIVMCKRSFNLDGAFIGNFRGLDFMEYDKKPLGMVYPYVACSTITESFRVWRDLYDILLDLDDKFKVWYGDQEALKKYAEILPSESFGVFEEAVYGCLPDEKYYLPQASILHFKGAQRKPIMKVFHKQMLEFVNKKNSESFSKG